MRLSRTVPTAILLLLFFSIALSAYLLYVHYTPSGNSFCDFGKNFNCDIVNKSAYSKLFGIPVALLSLITFLFLLSTFRKIQSSRTPLHTKQQLATLHVFLLGTSTLFAAYLFYIELVYLLTLCIFCLLLDSFIILLLVLSIIHYGILHAR